MLLLGLGTSHWLAACSASPPTPPLSVAAPAPASPKAAESVTSDAVPSGAFIFYEDFENGAARWQLPAVTPASEWRLLNAPSCGGMWTMLIGQADRTPFTGPAGESIFTLVAPIDLAKAVKPILKFDVKGLATPEDAVSIQAEVKLATGDWTPIGHPAIGNHAFVGSVVCDLGPFVGKRISLRFRATLKQALQPSYGLYLDDIAVIEPQ
jgi:hypothetical protein